MPGETQMSNLCECIQQLIKVAYVLIFDLQAFKIRKISDINQSTF